MDSIYLTSSQDARQGLRDMMRAAGMEEYVRHYVDVEAALLIVAIAKRAEDKPEWFPYGKWATIQNIERLISEQLDALEWHDEGE